MLGKPCQVIRYMFIVLYVLENKVTSLLNPKQCGLFGQLRRGSQSLPMNAFVCRFRLFDWDNRGKNY
jgi:hypothetical protein